MDDEGERQDREASYELARKVLAGEISAGDAAAVATEAAQAVAARIVSGQIDPRRGALAIYRWAWEGSAWDDSDPSPQLRRWGAEFIQLVDFLEDHQADPEQLHAYQALTRDFARSVVDGTIPPEWHWSDRGPVIAPPSPGVVDE